MAGNMYDDENIENFGEDTYTSPAVQTFSVVDESSSLYTTHPGSGKDDGGGTHENIPDIT